MDLGGNSASGCERAFRESETRGTPVIVYSPPPHNMRDTPHITRTHKHTHTPLFPPGFASGKTSPRAADTCQKSRSE